MRPFPSVLFSTPSISFINVTARFVTRSSSPNPALITASNCQYCEALVRIRIWKRLPVVHYTEELLWLTPVPRFFENILRSDRCQWLDLLSRDLLGILPRGGPDQPFLYIASRADVDLQQIETRRGIDQFFVATIDFKYSWPC